MTQSFENIVFSVLEKYKSYSFLAAISGGADSMALLSSLCAFVHSCKVNVLHINHNLRSQESNEDAEFVRSFCEGKNIPCTIVTIPPGKIEAYAKKHNTGIEAAARHFRRKALLVEAKRLDSMKPHTLILTAHTKNDVLELILMRILRGAGPAGLAAMPVKKGRFVRPMLEVTREQVIAYLNEKQVQWREDSSNKDESFLRNKIRHRLIPFLGQISSRKSAEFLQSQAITKNTQKTQRNYFDWSKGIEGMAATQALVAEFISSEVEKRIVWEEGKSEEGKGKRLITDESNFFLQPQIIREESIFKALNSLCDRCVSAPLREAIPKRYVIRQFCSGVQKACDLGSVRLERKNGKITITPVKKDFSEAGISYIIN